MGFPEEEGWLTILDSGYIHNGGGKPRNATDDKVRVWCMKAKNPAGTDCIFFNNVLKSELRHECLCDFPPVGGPQPSFSLDNLFEAKRWRGRCLKEVRSRELFEDCGPKIQPAL